MKILPDLSTILSHMFSTSRLALLKRQHAQIESGKPSLAAIAVDGLRRCIPLDHAAGSLPRRSVLAVWKARGMPRYRPERISKNSLLF
jgi:hypothetical protein